MNAEYQRDLPTAVIFHRHQQEKKRSYNKICREVEIFLKEWLFYIACVWYKWGVGSECSMFLATLAVQRS